MATIRATLSPYTKPDGTANIRIRITQKRKSVYIQTDLFIRPADFKNGWATGENSSFVNMRIMDEISAHQRRYLKIGEHPERYNAKELKTILESDNANTGISFFEFADAFLEKMKSGGRSGTYRGYYPVIVHMKKFRAVVMFSDIDFQFLHDFEMYLRRQSVTSAIPSYMAKLRAIFNAGRNRYNDEDRGIIQVPNYPFRKYKIRFQKNPATYNHLTADQMKLLISHDCKTRRTAFARDMFLLMVCLMGINTKDLYTLPVPGKNGRIHYRRSKTGKEFNVKVESEAGEIISRYSGNGRAVNVNYSDYLHFQKAINEGLKTISEAKKWLRVTSNWARHTWATIARNDCGIDKDTISKALGHASGENVTDTYIRYDYGIVDRANRQVISKLFS